MKIVGANIKRSSKVDIMSSRITRCMLVVVLATAIAPGSESASARGQRLPRPSPIYSPTYPVPSPNVRSHCLHTSEESAEQAIRREQVLTAIRAINTAQMRQRRDTGTFLETAALLKHPDVLRLVDGRNAQVAPGWQLRLVTSADAYLLVIKDTLDPCGFAYFSDDTGLIYTGQAIS